MVAPHGSRRHSGCVLAYTLVLIFRIVDDLADLRNDRLRHPDRVLVRASSRNPIVVLVLVIALGDVLMMLSQPHPGARIAVFASISLLLGLWYHRRARFNAGPLAGAHVLLLKYPAISLLTCASWDGLKLYTALPSLGVIYLGLCIYEQVHDRAVRESRAAPWIFAAEVAYSCPASRCLRFRLEVSCNDSRCFAGEWSGPVRATHVSL